MLHALFILDDHHEINAFYANLQSPATAGDCEECGGTPTAACRAACCHTLAALRAKHETALDHVRHDGDTFRVIKHLVGNSFVWSGHDFVHHFRGVIQPIDSFLAIVICPAHGRR